MTIRGRAKSPLEGWSAVCIGGGRFRERRAEGRPGSWRQKRIDLIKQAFGGREGESMERVWREDFKGKEGTKGSGGKLTRGEAQREGTEGEQFCVD